MSFSDKSDSELGERTLGKPTGEFSTRAHYEHLNSGRKEDITEGRLDNSSSKYSVLASLAKGGSIGTVAYAASNGNEKFALIAGAFYVAGEFFNRLANHREHQHTRLRLSNLDQKVFR